MIWTRFETPITKILSIDAEGWAKVIADDGREREWHVSELRADGGVKEIYDSAEKVYSK